MRNVRLRFLNSEWYRNPVSQLEWSVRVPRYVSGFISILFQKLILKSAIIFTLLWILISNLTLNLPARISLALFVALFTSLIWEFLSVKRWYGLYILPKHLEVVKKIKDFRVKSESKNIYELVRGTEALVDEYTKGIERLVYIGLYTWLIEIIIRKLYPLISSGKNYRNLFIGFLNKNTEADMKLWQAANKKIVIKEKY